MCNSLQTLPLRKKRRGRVPTGKRSLKPPRPRDSSRYTAVRFLPLVINEGVFQKRYPEIKIVTIIGDGGADAVNRILAERRAAKYVADLVLGTSSSLWTLHLIKALDPIDPLLILPEVTDELKWWQGLPPYVDTGKQYIFTFMGSPRGGSVFYNTNLVNPNEINSYWDLLDSKWKGKIEARDLRGRDSVPPSVRFFAFLL